MKPIRGQYNSHKSGGYLPGGRWDNGLQYMNIYTEDEQSMLLGTEVDIYPAGEPRYTEKEYAEELHSMLREIEEAQPDPCAITALIPDMLMVDGEDVPVFGVVQNINNASDSFDEDKYVTGAVAKEKSPEDMTFPELVEALKSNLEDLHRAIDDFQRAWSE